MNVSPITHKTVQADWKHALKLVKMVWNGIQKKLKQKGNCMLSLSLYRGGNGSDSKLTLLGV